MVSSISRRTRLSVIRLVLIAGIGISSILPLAAQSSPPLAVTRVTGPVDENSRVVLAGNIHPLARRQFDQGDAPASTATGGIWLVLQRSPAQQRALTQYLADVQNPHSARYRQWLTPAQYGAAFGLTDSDLQSVQGWLTSHGFTINKVPAARNAIQFSGSFGQVESAFHTGMHTYAVNGARHYANATDPQIPAALAPVIAGVASLNDFHPASLAKMGARGHFNSSTHRIQPDFTLFSGSTPLLFVDPADAATIYDTPNATLNTNYKGSTLDGTGVNIGIAGDSNIVMQDEINYRVGFLNETAASANTPTVIVDGADPLVNGDEGEALLDTEVSGGIAPQAKVYLYTSADSDLASGLSNAIMRAIDDNTVSILNISFGECEQDLGSAGDAQLTEAEEQAAAQGISVTAAAGDSGSAGCDADNEEQATQGFGVNGFASTPYAIAAGGTDFDVLANNFTQYVEDSSGGKLTDGTPPYWGTALSYIPEEPWNDSTQDNGDLSGNSTLLNGGDTDIVAGGGGVSSCATSTGTACTAGYAKPAFQTSLTPTDGVRDVPDVAFLAGNGLYGAVWLVCADHNQPGAGSDTQVSDCATTDGQFTSQSTFSGYGGTSAAAPVLAGMLALVEQKTGSRLGQADTVLYQLASSHYATVFHDVTTGNNSVVCASGSPDCGTNNFMTGYNAGTGYDYASGLGSVDAAQMVNLWSSVALTSTSTAFSINGSTSPVNVTHGTTLTFTTGVTPTTATGAVAVVDTANETAGGTQVGPQNDGQIAIPLTAGTGSTQYNGLPGGSYSVYARYGGDTNDAASTSTPAIQVTVSPEASTAGLTVNAYSGAYTASVGNAQISNLGSVPYGSYIFLDAQIYGKAEGASTQGLATGSVKLTDGSTVLAPALAVTSGNQVSYQTPSTAYPAAFALGQHSIVAAYAGDPSYNASISAAVPFTVVKDATTIFVAPTKTSINSQVSDVIDVVVNTTSVGSEPTGTLTLTANGNTLGTLTGGYLAGESSTTGADAIVGLFTVNGSALAAGNNTLTATYSGDGNYTGSTGTATVTVAESAFNLSNNGAISVAPGATTGNTSLITVAPTNGFVGVVSLSCAVTTAPAGGTSPATCSVPATVNITGTGSVSGTMTLTTTSSTTPGAYAATVTGVDATTGKITATTIVNVTVTGVVASAGFSLSNGGAITVNPGASTGNTATLTVTPSGGFTGQVNLSCAVTTALVNPTDPPTCGVPATVTIAGTAAATATLTVTTTAGTTAMNEPLRFGFPGTLLAAVLFFGFPKRRRRLGGFFAVAVLMLLASAGVMGCGNSGGSSGGGGGTQGGTTAGTYTVTITAVDAATGKISETSTVSVVVN
jgi:trimeric autotransporter adhesin